MTEIIPVAGTPGIEVVQGEMIAVKPICEALGLDAWSQIAKIKKKSWATTGIIPAVGADGKNREMFCINKEAVPMWLANIDENRVKPETRPMLIAYQKEAAKALNDYFTKGAAINPNLRIASTLEAERLALIATARDLGFIDPQHANAQAQIQLAIGLGKAPAIEQVFIYCEAYLRERGCAKDFAKKYRGAFGKKVSELYQERYGVKPPRHQGEVGGKVTTMYYYTPKDRDLLDQVFDSYIAPKIATTTA